MGEGLDKGKPRIEFNSVNFAKSCLFVLSIAAIFAVTGFKYGPAVVSIYLFFLLIFRNYTVYDIALIFFIISPLVDFSVIGDTRSAVGMPALTFSRLVSIIMVIGISLERRENPQTIRFNKLDISLMTFLVVSFISIIVSFQVKYPLRIFLDALMIPFLFYVVAKNSIGEGGNFYKIQIVACICCLIFGVIGVSEKFLGTDILRLPESNFYEESSVYRVNGPFRNSEEYGMVMIYFLGFVMTLKQHCGNLLKNVRGLMIVIGAIAIYSTLTRSIWIAFIIAAILYLIQNNMDNIKMVIFVIIAATVLFLVYEGIKNTKSDLMISRIKNENTINARIATYNSAIKMFSDHVLLGCGYGNYTEIYEQNIERYSTVVNDESSVRQPHSSYLSLLVETGLIGLLTYLVIYVLTFKYAYGLRGIEMGDTLPSGYAEVCISIMASYLIVGIALDAVHNIGYFGKLHLFIVGTISGLYNKYNMNISVNEHSGP